MSRAKQLQDRPRLPGTPVRVQSGVDGPNEREDANDKGNRKGRSKCAVCLGLIVDGRDEAIFCEGQCKMWFHRGCASVSQKLLTSLTTSDEPFLCLMCSRSQFQQEVTELRRVVDALKAELLVIPEMRKEIVSMKQKMEEIPLLKQKIDAMSKDLSVLLNQKSTPSSTRTQAGKRSYAGAVLRNSRPAESYKPDDTNAALAGTTAIRRPSSPRVRSNTDKSSRTKVKVSGARRIWGTLKTATTTSVSYSLRKLSSLVNKFSLKRKFKTNSTSGRTHWWFIVKGSESDLEELEKEWDRVQLQTGWKLELCYMSSSEIPDHDAAAPDSENNRNNDVSVNSPDPESPDSGNELTNNESQIQGQTDGASQSPFLDDLVPSKTT